MSKNDFVGIDSVHMKYKKKKLKPLAPYIALTLTVPNFFIGTCSHDLIFPILSINDGLGTHQI